MIPLRDTEPAKRKPYITWVLIGVNLVIFLFQLTLDEFTLRTFFMEWGMVPLNFTQPDAASAAEIPYSGPWTFLTSMFLHGGFAHLIFNMWALWIFGDNVEDQMGGVRYVGFYLLCGILATGVHLVFNWGSPMPVIGASGALAGVMAAYMFLFPQSRILTFIPIFFLPWLIEVRAQVFIGIWLFFQVISGMMGLFASAGSSGVAFWAHVGGFVAGWILYRYFLRPENEEDDFEAEYVDFEEV